MSNCWLNKEPFYQCCCNCKNLLKLNLHCNNVIEKPKDMGCICGIQIGWVCTAFESDGVAYLFDTNHSVGCELYDRKEAIK